MTKRRRNPPALESLCRAFYDIAQVLESAENSGARVIRVLERLRSIVPYERCVLLEALPGSESRFFTTPEMPEAERGGIEAKVLALLIRLTDERRRHPEGPWTPSIHIAVPLVGLDEIVGVLFVELADGAYEERHVRRLSVVAAKLASYLSMLRACALETERARQLDEARRVAEAANRAKDEFLALVSHELRTPLNTILTWADALRSKEAREIDRARAFDGIERCVRREVKLIDELLDLSSVASATLRLDLRALEPAKLIQATISALLPRAQEKSIRLEAVLDDSVKPLIGDPHRLGQVVAGLVANAIKFTPDGGTVEVRLERIGVLARIRVIDSGSGIRPEILPNLFDRFHQADSSSTRAHGGLGVGLSLVKNLVELHGGRVQVESPGEQKGATFTVELPLVGTPSRTYHAGDGATERETPAPPNTKLEPGDVRVLAGLHVLIVDDDADICEVLQFVLEGQGAVVTVATSVPEGLKAIERSMPNVLISDIAMPGETGYDLMRKIVAEKGDGALPAAGLTAYATEQAEAEALASGFQLLLAKPIDPETLIATVAALARTGSNDSAAIADERSPP